MDVFIVSCVISVILTYMIFLFMDWLHDKMTSVVWEIEDIGTSTQITCKRCGYIVTISVKAKDPPMLRYNYCPCCGGRIRRIKRYGETVVKR